MTPDAISRRTSIPLKIITAGLEHLSKPDPYSRTPGDDGRRIVLLDDHRPWGWRLVNHAKYRALRDLEHKREADRERIAEKRRKTNDVATPSQGVANVAHTDSDADTDSNAGKTKPAPSAARVDAAKPALELIEDKVVEKIPLCNKTEFEVRQSFVAELDRLYPAVDPVQTLREIRGWCIGNPTRTKTKRGVKAFITSWFAREQDKQSRRVA
jgi:hypothetical protein